MCAYVQPSGSTTFICNDSHWFVISVTINSITNTYCGLFVMDCDTLCIRVDIFICISIYVVLSFMYIAYCDEIVVWNAVGYYRYSCLPKIIDKNIQYTKLNGKHVIIDCLWKIYLPESTLIFMKCFLFAFVSFICAFFSLFSAFHFSELQFNWNWILNIY